MTIIVFNNVIRRIFNLSVRTSVKNVLLFFGAKPVKLLTDKRKCLLVVSCFNSSCEMLRRYARVVATSDDFKHDFNRVKAVYGVHENMNVWSVHRAFDIIIQENLDS